MQFHLASVDSLVISFSESISLKTSQKVKFYYEALKSMEGIIELIPSYTTLFIQYDIFQWDMKSLKQLIKAFNYNPKKSLSKPNCITIPVYYDLEVGPDLQRISVTHNITIEDIIKKHSKKVYTVYAIGFAPGFAYLGEVSKKIAMERLESPRKMIPKGSVGIANRQTAIYPQNSPGGWNIIGRTPVEMFDKTLDALCPVNMGDEVKFEAISKETYIQMGGEIDANGF